LLLAWACYEKDRVIIEIICIVNYEFLELGANGGSKLFLIINSYRFIKKLRTAPKNNFRRNIMHLSGNI
jgi:hypothetical protein